jgi:hypothetical protein
MRQRVSLDHLLWVNDYAHASRKSVLEAFQKRSPASARSDLSEADHPKRVKRHHALARHYSTMITARLSQRFSSREQNSQHTTQHCQEKGWLCSFQMGIGVTELFVVITVIAVALIFDYTNGFHDSANAMAGPIATGALRPRIAVILAAGRHRGDRTRRQCRAEPGDVTSLPSGHDAWLGSRLPRTPTPTTAASSRFTRFG